MDTQPGSENQNLPTDPQPEGTSQPAKRVPKGMLIVIVVGLLVVAGGAFGFWEYQQSQNSPVSVIAVNPTQPQPGDNNYPTATPPQNSTTTLPSQTGSGTCLNPGPVMASRSGMIQWQDGVLDRTLNLFAAATTTSGYVDDSSVVVGHFVSGKYQGGDLLITTLSTSYDWPGGDTPTFYHIVRQGNLYTVLDKYSDKLPDPSDIKSLAPVSEDPNFDLPDLDMPTNLPSTDPVADLALASISPFTPHWQDFCADGLVKAFTDPAVGDVYTDQFALSPKNSNLDYGFYAKSPDGSTVIYALTLDIVGTGDVPMITWNNGQKNTHQYNYTDRTGCGSYNYASVEPADTINPATELVQSGTAINNQPVYELKDPNSPILKDVYDNNYYGNNNDTKFPYDQFVKAHPLFFWKDNFGRLIKFQDSTLVPMAECGKPVIYLYPQQTEKISVQIDPKGGLSKSEPAYNGGWNVISDPLSNITNLSDGQTYPYLFWEGRGGMYQTPDKGFVVAQADVHGFLQAKLRELGLNDKESADFMDFWEPKMQGSPYYFVTFMGNNVMDQLAPLTISPKPDTVIRILMDFKPLAEPINVRGFNIHTPERKGFTVVEWGGVLRNDKN